MLTGCAQKQEIKQEVKQEQTISEIDRWNSMQTYVHYNKDEKIEITDYDYIKTLPSTAEKCVYGAIEGETKGLEGKTLEYVKGFFNSYKTDFKIVKVKALEMLLYDSNTVGVYVGVLAETKLNADGTMSEEASLKECLAQLAFVKDGETFNLEEFAFRENDGKIEIFTPDTAYYGLNDKNRIDKIFRKR